MLVTQSIKTQQTSLRPFIVEASSSRSAVVIQNYGAVDVRAMRAYNTGVGKRLIESFIAMIAGGMNVQVLSNSKVDVAATNRLNNLLSYGLHDQILYATLNGEFITVVTSRRGSPERVDWYPPSTVAEYTAFDGFVPTTAVIGDRTYPVVSHQHPSTDRSSYVVHSFWRLPKEMGLRGQGEWAELSEPILMLDNALVNGWEGSQVSSITWWDVLLQGADEQRIRDWLQSPDAVPPSNNVVMAHNENVQWEMKSNTQAVFNALERAPIQVQLLFALAGVLPIQFNGRIYDFTEDVTSYLRLKQDVVKNYYTLLANSIIHTLQSRQRLNPTTHYEVQINLPDVGIKELQRKSGAIARLGQTLMQFADRGWIDDKTAQQYARRLLGI